MRKRDAMRLKPGAVVVYYRTSRIDDCPMLGVVAKVTDRGGILIYPHSYRHPHVSHNHSTWVKYSQAAQVRKKGANDFRATVDALNSGARPV